MIPTTYSGFLHPRPSFVLNIQGRAVDISRGMVMGILNVTPDSFYDGGKFTEESLILENVEKLVSGGAQIIDVGGASSRPGAELIPEEAEYQRVIPAIRLIKKYFPEAEVSIDTWRSNIARAAVEEGAGIINDISGGELDPEMFTTAGKCGVPYILMHMKGTPQTMQDQPSYTDVTLEVMQYFTRKMSDLRIAGVKDILLDPGFGFGKTTEHNYTLLKNLQLFHRLDAPLVCGFSRKSMINKVLKTKPETALNGTTVLNTIAALHGTHIFRVHDAREARECLDLINFYAG
jgi:dihydropteroate synthase